MTKNTNPTDVFNRDSQVTDDAPAQVLRRIGRRKGSVAGGGKVANFWVSTASHAHLKEMSNTFGLSASAIIDALITEAYAKGLRFELREVSHKDGMGMASMRSRVLILGPKR
jgi:hypothetical protein